MDEQFEHRSLLSAATLRVLQQRDNRHSALRLLLQLALFAASATMIVAHAKQPLIAVPASLVLAFGWAAIFAPFHEATHQTAFQNRSANALATWVTGILFGLAPVVYRTFHFEHHRHTQDLERDPEIAPDPHSNRWPPTRRAWVRAALGGNLIGLKLSLTLEFLRRRRSEWSSLGAWTTHFPDPAQVERECRIVSAVWAVFVVSAVTWLPGGFWLLVAAWLAHVWQTLWLMCEHSGLPHDGPILRRTRTVLTNAHVRWWLWNMNYHAEHHAWPSIPWHRLPAAHAAIAPHLEACASGGYGALHRSVLAGQPDATPTG